MHALDFYLYGKHAGSRILPLKKKKTINSALSLWNDEIILLRNLNLSRYDCDTGASLRKTGDAI